MTPGSRTSPPGVAFYCVSSAEYFLGAVGLVNSLRLHGHDEPIHLLDCGLTDAQRGLLEDEVTVVAAPRGAHPSALKACAPLRHPAETMVLIDTDVIVTRRLDPLIDEAAAGKVVAFENNVDRFAVEWEDLLDLGPISRRRYLCSGFVAMARDPGEEVLGLLDDRVRRVDQGRGYFGAGAGEYPLLYADQDVLNAILASRVEPERVVAIEHELAPAVPFSGLEVRDQTALRCAYEDGREPFLVHHLFSPKPWQRPAYEGVYSRLLRRLLSGDDVAVRVPKRDVPMRLRAGRLGRVAQGRVDVAERVRWRLGALRGEAAGAAAFAQGEGGEEPGAERPVTPVAAQALGATGDRRPSAAFYCMSSDMYFLGAVALVNSLRLHGHTEPIYLLDCGLGPAHRALLEPHVTVVDPPEQAPPWLLKTVAPLRHPAEVMVLIDADMIATQRLDPLIDEAAAGKVVAFENNMERYVAEWGEILDLGPIRREPYLCSGLVAMARDPGEEVLRLMEDRQRRVEFELTYFARDDPDYPLRYLDQDVLNAILSSRIAPEQVARHPLRLAPMPPFEGLEVIDEDALRCAYEDGVEPYVVHHYVVKPWLEPTHHGVYSRLLRRLLVGEGLTVRVEEEELPLRLRTGLRAYAARKRVNARERLRFHVLDPLRERRAGNSPGRERSPGGG